MFAYPSTTFEQQKCRSCNMPFKQTHKSLPAGNCLFFSKSTQFWWYSSCL